LDQSIEIEPIQNQVDVVLIKVETIHLFIAPVQVVTERNEVGTPWH
jgi:hypothetical protein